MSAVLGKSRGVLSSTSYHCVVLAVVYQLWSYFISKSNQVVPRSKWADLLLCAGRLVEQSNDQINILFLGKTFFDSYHSLWHVNKG